MSAWKIFTSLLIVISSLFLNLTPSLAAINPQEWKAPQQTNYTIINLENTVGCEGIGIPLIKNQKCTYYDNNGQLGLLDKIPQGGALGGINNVMAAMYDNPPTSTAQYLASVKNNLGLAKPVYAQSSGIPGSGDGVILPVLKLWEVSRNISYLAFIIVFMVAGFMVMFRQKINPQTVISLQQALPGLVVGLILVTFSYFIAAFIIDLSFFAMQLVAFLFTQSGIKEYTDPNTLQGLARNSNVFGLFGSFIWSSALGDIIKQFVQLFTPPPEYAQKIGEMVATTAGPGIGIVVTHIPGIGSLIATQLGTYSSRLVGAGIGELLVVVIIIGLLIQMFRLAWSLVTSYITILVITIAGPLIILASSIPGRGGGLSFWWKTLLANVLVFPAVFAAFLFAGAILSNTTNFQQTMPLFSGLPVDLLKTIIGIGIVLGTPAVPGMVKEAFGVKEIKGIPEAAMAGFAGGLAPISAGVSRASKETWARIPWVEQRRQRKIRQEELLKARIRQEVEPTNPGREGGQG